MRFARITVTFLALIVLLGAFAVPAQALERSEEIQEPDPLDDWYVVDPTKVKRTYKKRVNLAARKPMRKKEGPSELQVEEHTQIGWNRNLVARKKPYWWRTNNKTRWEQIKTVARGPIKMPVE